MKYSASQITYHWASFALICLMIGTGLAYSYELAGNGAMQIHQIAGQVLIAILILRLITRVRTKTNESAVEHNLWERRLAQGVHIGLYVVMIAFVVTGYVSASAETKSALLAPVSLAFARSDMGELLLEIHFLLKWALLALVGLHVAGALKHHFWDKDKTLSHMTFNARKG